jgi:hypothetical protein
VGFRKTDLNLRKTTVYLNRVFLARFVASIMLSAIPPMKELKSDAELFALMQSTSYTSRRRFLKI